MITHPQSIGGICSTQALNIAMQAGFQTLDFSQDLLSDPVWQKIQIPLGDRAVFDSIPAAVHYEVDYATASNEASTIRLLIVSALAHLQNSPDFINMNPRWRF